MQFNFYTLDTTLCEYINHSVIYKYMHFKRIVYILFILKTYVILLIKPYEIHKR